uniref:G protein-coupled receptor GPR1/2/3 C-terminal domain-containing protein n=1 Tax=Electrophorus electricus TaxID=8005 RepID=A0A4W4H8Z0_ELEEL
MDILFWNFLNNSQLNTTGPPENLTSVYSTVWWIQIIMAVLSIIGSGSIIFYAVFQRLVRTSEVQPLFLLSLTDLLLAVSWLSGALLFKSCDSYVSCYNLHTVEQTLYMASFFYTLNYVWVLYMGLKDNYNRTLNGFPAQVTSQAMFRTCHGLTKSTEIHPVFILFIYRCLLLHTGALYLTSPVSNMLTSCKIISTYTIIIFLITFFFTLIGIVIMHKACSLYRRCFTSRGFFGDRQWATLRVLEQRMVLYPCAYLFCWAPAILLASLMLIRPQEVKGRVGMILYILEAFTCASQGFLNCIVYGWTQQHFRSLSSVTVRDADTQTPLLRSQRRTYASLSSSSLPTQIV